MKMQKVGRWVGGVLLLLGLILFFAPSILGSRWVYQPLVNRLAAGDFKLSVGSVRLSWFSSLRMSDIRVIDAKGPELLKIESIQTDQGLISFLVNGSKFGKITINQPTINVLLLEDESNLDRLVRSLAGDKKPGSEERSSKFPAFDVAVEVIGLSVRVEGSKEKGNEPIVIVPPTDIAASYTGLDGSPRLQIEPTKLLDQVAITPELIRIGLGHAVPMLAKSAWFDGRVSVSLGDISIPLDRPEDSNGIATITLHQVRSGPSDPAIIDLLSLVAATGGRVPQMELVFIDGTVVEIGVKEGRVHHEGLKFGLPKVDPRLQLATRGSVGMKDRSLDLQLAVPVPLEFLAQRESVRGLGVPSIDIPIGGTLDKPKVDLAAMRGDSAELIGAIRSTIQNEAPGTAAALGAIEGLAGGQADEVIGAAIDVMKVIRKKRQEKKEAAAKEAAESVGDVNAADKTAAEKGDSETTGRPLRDALRGLLRGRNEPQ